MAAARQRLRRRCSRFEAVAQLRKQLEYCLSIGKLHKDVFLRTQMGVGGFVDLAELSRFSLIAALAADAAELADAACGSCGVLETAVVTAVRRVWPRVLGARRRNAAALGSWVLGGVYENDKPARCRRTLPGVRKTGGTFLPVRASSAHRRPSAPVAEAPYAGVRRNVGSGHQTQPGAASCCWSEYSCAIAH